MASVAELLSWLQSSPVIRILDESFKTTLSSLFEEMKPFLTNAMTLLDDDTKETVKERNYALERDLLQHCLSGIKSVMVQMMYGSNKCDYTVCYNKARSMSSAISFFDRTVVFTAVLFCAFCLFICSVSFYIEHTSISIHQSQRSSHARFDSSDFPRSFSHVQPLFPQSI